MGYFALVWDNAVHSVAVSGSVPDPAIAGEWVDVTDMEPRPSPGCRYEDGKFLIQQQTTVAQGFERDVEGHHFGHRRENLGFFV